MFPLEFGQWEEPIRAWRTEMAFIHSVPSQQGYWSLVASIQWAIILTGWFSLTAKVGTLSSTPIPFLFVWDSGWKPGGYAISCGFHFTLPKPFYIISSLNVPQLFHLNVPSAFCQEANDLQRNCRTEHRRYHWDYYWKHVNFIY